MSVTQLAHARTAIPAVHPKLRKMTSRQTIITELCDRYDEFVATLHASGPDGTGDGTGLMPSTYTASMRELEHWLRHMRDTRHQPLKHLPDGRKASLRQLWWHVMHWHVKARRCTGEAIIIVSKHGHPYPSVDQHGRPRRPKPGQRIERNPDGSPARQRISYHERTGDPELAAAGTAWIAQQFRFEPELPKAARQAA